MKTNKKDKSALAVWPLALIIGFALFVGMVLSMPIIALLFNSLALIRAITLGVLLFLAIYVTVYYFIADSSFYEQLFCIFLLVGIFVGSPIIYQQMQIQAQASLLLPTQYISASLFPLASNGFPFNKTTIIYTASIQANKTACIGGGYMSTSAFNYTTQTNTYINKTLNNTQVFKAYQAASGYVWPSSTSPADSIQLLPGRTLLCPNTR